MDKFWTKGTASAVPHPPGLMRALAPEVRFLPDPGNTNLTFQQHCHLDRSVAKWRDLRFYLSSKSEGDVTS